ncbi:MAG: RNA polymerase sigma factor [Gaiellaceae bacterium]|jgi:RNA polymerase sigma-70 factor (ECF subfamily)|nr:sigma-70 family RNA polymerase sigma factor [Acidobacteriota bacterium]
MNEAKLIALARSGSEVGIRELFHRFWPLAWQWAYAVLGDRMLADQAAQEAIAKAFQSLDRFDPQRPFAPWLKRIVVNRAIDDLRHERRRCSAERWAEMPAVIAVERDGDSLHATFEAVRALPSNQRLAIVLHYWLDFGVEDIARQLRTPVGTVVSRLSRARAAIRQHVEANDVF